MTVQQRNKYAERQGLRKERDRLEFILLYEKSDSEDREFIYGCLEQIDKKLGENRAVIYRQQN
ncbi:hypothetical protein FACS1894211_02540 [Clostridia bacterium]|nr:hypothetical protein FACS1894211_02540 [Clostridia bacterium]